MDRYAKAIVGALIAALTAIGAGTAAASAAGTHMTADEWIVAAIAFISGLSLVWAVPNSQPPGDAGVRL